MLNSQTIVHHVILFLQDGSQFNILLMMRFFQFTMENIKENVKDWKDRDEVENYLLRILRKEANDKSGKIYGVGHAVYTVSDPRALLLREKARDLANESGRLDEFELYCLIEEVTPDVFRRFKGEGNGKTVCVNVDFYSGFVYSCIGISKDLYTPLFAMARIAGWCAHRIEELTFSAKRIIRPAFKNVYGARDYVTVCQR